MKIHKTPFPVHTNTHIIDLNNAKVLIRPEQAEGAEGKNVVFGETRPENVDDKILAREVVLEKAPDGKELIKITVKAHVHGGQEGSSSATSRPAVQDRPIRPVRPGLTEDLQAQAPGSGYLEAECAKDSREDGCSETNLWPASEQVHEGCSTRSATKKESLVTPASRWFL